MTRFDAIVIGGGINGLAAATTLARKGKSVCLVEARNTLGGMATYAIGNGPPLANLLHNLSPAVLASMGVDPSAIKTRRLRTAVLGDAPVIVDGAAARMADGTPHPDSERFAGLVDRLTSYGALLRQLAEAPAPVGAPDTMARLRQLWRLGRFGMSVKRLGKVEMRRFLQLLLSNAYDAVLDELPDGPLTGMLAADAVRGAATGPRSPGTVFNLIYRMGHGGNPELPEGSMTQVFNVLADAAKNAGVTISTGVRVKQITLEDGYVTGVETDDGPLKAPLVLSTQSLPATVRSLGAAHLDIEATRRARHLRARGTVAKVNLQLNGLPELVHLPDPADQYRLLIAPSADYVETAFNPAKYGGMSDTPVIEAVIVQGATGPWLSANVQFAPSNLTGGWTDAAKDTLLKTTLAAFAPYVPGLEPRIESTQVITPSDIETATGTPGGHWHQAEMALDQLLTLRPVPGFERGRVGPAGLYLCGASAHPGGDVMGLAGRNAAFAVLEDLA
ncbi:MAG: NAD(P)/FAD-dependent oxidoreductase [Pseudomonadota bacterium]